MIKYHLLHFPTLQTVFFLSGFTARRVLTGKALCLTRLELDLVTMGEGEVSSRFTTATTHVGR